MKTHFIVGSALVLVVEMALNVRDWAREDVFVLCWSWPSARSRVANGIAVLRCAAAASLLPLRRWTGWWRWTNPSWRGAQLHAAAAAALPMQPPPPAPCQSPAHIVQKTISTHLGKWSFSSALAANDWLTTDVSKLELLLSLRGTYFCLRLRREPSETTTTLDLSINQGMDHVCHREEQALSRWKPILFQVHTWKEKARRRQREGQAARELDFVHPNHAYPRPPGDAFLKSEPMYKVAMTYVQKSVK